MSYLIVFIAGVALGGWLAWTWGWNAAVRLYEHRAVKAAHERAEADRK